MLKQIKVTIGYECTVPTEQYGNIKPFLDKEYLFEGEGDLELEAQAIISNALKIIPNHSNRLYQMVKKSEVKLDKLPTPKPESVISPDNVFLN